MIQQQRALTFWLRKLATLRVDKASKTPAPHKPLLLLAILDQIEDETITSSIIRLTPELAFRFLGYWEIVGARGRSVGRVELPYFYLRSDGLLKHVAHPGLESALASIRPTSVELLNRLISHSEIPEEFFALMKESANRTQARQVLISGDWFLDDERVQLTALLGLAREAVDAALTEGEATATTARNQGRDIKFRLQIVPLYRYACALCGMKVLLPSGATLVEAAHIHQFAQSRNDDVANGMALCRNHHWAFDQGLWTLGPSNEVLVANGQFLEHSPNQTSLLEYRSRCLDFTWLQPSQRPSQINLDWHRKHKYVGLSHALLSSS